MTTITRTETPGPGARARVEEARQAAGDLGGALGAAGKAYVAGVLELGRTLAGFGREVVTETGEHVRATARAKSLREAAELQAAFAQHRIEISATHAKEFVDLARARTEQAIAPVANLLRQDAAA